MLREPVVAGGAAAVRSLDTLFRPDGRRPMARVRGVLALLLVAVLPAACATGPVTEADTPERAVEDSFVAFRQAVLDGDGEQAAALTPAATIGRASCRERVCQYV